MADSVRVIDDDYIKRIHSRNPAGRIHKGHHVVAATASIPCKYQTVVTDNSDRLGFQAQAKRFQENAEINDIPGPGKYVSHTTVDNNSASFSKKGTGGFASKTKRQLSYQGSGGPGAGLYALPGLLSTRKDFNKAASTSSFHQPIAQPSENVDLIPAPNEYNILNSKVGKTNNVSANSAFKSQSKRDIINVKEATEVPAPWQYHVKDDLLHDSTKNTGSSFKSKSIRQMQPDPPLFPGPGTYKPNEPIEPPKRQIFPRKHYLCISAPAMPLPAQLPGPGPGSYDIKYMDPVKHFMSSAAFVSTTSRWTGEIQSFDCPGPAHYKPVANGRQSFIYNSAGRWI